jgi:hypothetical protein
MTQIYIPADAELVEAVARPRGLNYAITAEQAEWLKGKMSTGKGVGLATGNALRFFSIDPASVKETKQKQPRFSRKKAELALEKAGVKGVAVKLGNKGSVVSFLVAGEKPAKPAKNDKKK